MIFFEFFFLFLISLFLYTYLGYPLVLYIVRRLKKRKAIRYDIFPTVSIITAARNEDKVIGESIRNKLALNYPEEKFNIIIVSDDSEDGTDESVESFNNKNVQLIRQSPRKGKTAALNTAVKETDAEIIVFADANSIYDKHALKNLVRNFADPKIGYVTGHMTYYSKSGNVIGDGSSKYMQYENWLRELETSVGSVVGVDGGVDAVRRNLYLPMSEDAQPDFYLPLSVVEQGYRVVYEKDAVLKEYALDDSKDELKMRIRVSLRALRVIWNKKQLLNPFKYGFFSIQFLSHKLLRYLIGAFQFLIFINNLIIFDQSFYWKLLFIGQLTFYLLSVVSLVLGRFSIKNNLLTTIYYFNLLNFASCIALFKFFLGKNQILWEPRKG